MPFDWRSLTNGNTLFGTAPAGGVMGDETQAPNKDAMMALASQLLQGSGYSSQRTTFGQQAGAGLQAAMQARAQSLQDQQKAKYVAAQTQALQAKPLTQDPASVKEFEFAKQNGYTGTFQEWVVAGGQSSRPSSVQEWEFYNALPTDQKKLYLEMKRNPNFAVKDVNTVPTVIQPSVVAGTTTTPLSTQASEAQAAGEKKRQESSGGALGTAQGGITGGIETRGSNAVGTKSTLEMAEPLIEIATGSMAGAARDKVAAFFGSAPDSAQAIAQLKVLQANLMTSMPRMEGPQSDRDVQLYREAAGQIGDPTVPADIKKAAVRTIKELQNRYVTRAGGDASGPRSFATEAEAEAAGLKPGTRVTIGGVSGTWQ